MFDDCLSKKASVDVHEHYTYVVKILIDLKGKEKVLTSLTYMIQYALLK